MDGIGLHHHAGYGRIVEGLWRNEYARLMAVLGISLMAHVAIYYALSGAFPQIGRGESFVAKGHGAPMMVRLVKADAQVTGTSEASEPAARRPAGNGGRYFSLGQLEQPPGIDAAIVADGQSGVPEDEVVMRLWIDRSGRVTRVEPVTPELSQAFIASAMAYFMGEKFSPGMKDGYAVAAVVEVAVSRDTTWKRI